MLDLEFERKLLDRDITFFHFKRARQRIGGALKEARKQNDKFFVYYFLAQACILREEFNRAIVYLNFSLRIKENDGCAYNDKAICLAELKKYQPAINCFNEGIRRDRDCPSLYHNKGWLLNLLGRYKEAIICFSKALELDDGRPEALYSMADSYSKLKDISKAECYFKKALKAVKGKSGYVRQNILARLKELG